MSLDTIYLIHHTHTDIGFTHDQDTVFDLHRQFIDQVIDLGEQTEGYPAGSAMRWTCESALMVLDWLRHRDDAQIGRFLKLEKAGMIEVTGLFATMSQCLSHEATWRHLYPVRQLRSEYGITVRTAMASDINGQHWGLVDALRDVGIGHLNMAINENVGRAVFGATRPNAFHWESASGQRVLVWNGLHYNANQYFGIPDDFERTVRELPRFLQWLEARNYPYSFCLFQATHNTFNDNGPADPRLPEFVRRWNAEGRTPRMEIITLAQYFERLEKEPSIPTYRGEWSDFWNFAATSAAFETSLNRATERRLVEAEWLSTYLPRGAGRERELKEGWQFALLYDEHTWCSNVSSSQPWSLATRSQLNQKLNYAYRARSRAQLVKIEAADTLAWSLSASPGRYVLAVNPLPWARKERLPVPRAWLEGYSSRVPELIGASASKRAMVTREVHDTVSRIQYLDRDDFGEQQVDVVSDALISAPVEVPPLGYRLFSAEMLGCSVPGPVGPVEALKAENRFFAVELDGVRGGLASVFDKERSREWVDAAHPFSFGGYVYEDCEADRRPFRPTDWSRFMGYNGWEREWPARRRGVSRVVARKIQRMDGAVRLIQECEAPGLHRLIYEVLLDDEKPFIDFRVTLHKQWVLEPEACYVAFPMNLHGGVPRFEAVGGAVEVFAEQLPGSNQDFPTIQGWADWSDDQVGLTVCTPDAPIMHFGGFNIGKMNEGPLPAGNAFLASMLMSNYYDVNYPPAQHGPVTFLFRLCPHGVFDPVRASRQGREAASPVWGHPVKDPGGEASPCASFLEVDQPAFDLLACKPSETGSGVFLRLRNLAPDSRKGMLRFPGGRFQRAWLCDGLENRLREVSFCGDEVEIGLPPYATQGLCVE